MSRRTVPFNYMKRIAEEMITGEPAQRTKHQWPKSKRVILSEMVKTDKDIRKKVLQRYDEMLRDESLGTIEKSGWRLATAGEKQDSTFAAWTTEERRTWRLLWATEMLRNGWVGNLDRFGGPPTEEELQAAQRLLDGEPTPAELVGIGAFAPFELTTPTKFFPRDQEPPRC